MAHDANIEFAAELVNDPEIDLGSDYLAGSGSHLLCDKGP
jgi:hypothetical protein